MGAFWFPPSWGFPWASFWAVGDFLGRGGFLGFGDSFALLGGLRDCGGGVIGVWVCLGLGVSLGSFLGIGHCLTLGDCFASRDFLGRGCCLGLGDLLGGLGDCGGWVIGGQLQVLYL